MSQSAHLGKMISVPKRSYFPQRNRASEAFTDPLFHMSDYEDDKKSLRSNKPLNAPLVRISKTFIIDIAQYINKNLQEIIQTVF